MKSSVLRFKKTTFIHGIIIVCLAASGCGGCDDSGKAGAKDTTVPAKISLTGISAAATSITFTWTAPSDSDFDHVVITCSDGTNSESANVTAKTYTQSTLNSSALVASTQYTFTAKSADTTGNLSAAYTFYVKTASSDADPVSFTAISTVDELKAVADDLDGNYLLVADLDLSDYSTGEGWTPIGYWDYTNKAGHYFSGIFNGNNHVIRNLYIKSDGIDNNDSDKGLFGDVGDSEGAGTAQICNLGLESVSVTGTNYTGAIAGYTNSATITDCYVTGTVNGTDYTGGLAGYNNSSSITDCYAASAVTGVKYTGGLVGYNVNCEITGCKVLSPGSVEASGDCTGGLVGYNSAGEGNSIITGCSSSVDVTSNNGYIGGLVGRNQSGGGNIKISNSCSTGNVNASLSTMFNVGGLIGENYSSAAGLAVISNCYSTGNVYGSSNDVAALVGHNYDVIENCYATGSVSGTQYVGGIVGYNQGFAAISCCYSTGAVTGTASTGALAGYKGDTITACYYDEQTTGYDAAVAAGSTWTDAGTPRTTSQMKLTDTSVATYDGWDFVDETVNGTADIWSIDTTGTINDGYPYLTNNAPGE